MNSATIHDDIFGDVISSYSRAQAIEDGVLVDLRQGDLAKVVDDAGIKVEIAATAEVFASCIDLTPAAKRAGCDIKGRLWDVLWMFRLALRNAKPRANTIMFDALVVRGRVRPTKTRLKAVCGAGDRGEMVITIMFPEQD